MAYVFSNLLQRPMLRYDVQSFAGRRVAVTGGNGALGTALMRGGMPPWGGFWTPVDLPQAYDAIGTDILNYDALVRTLHGHKADMVVHAAANKHAPEGEAWPYPVADVNIRGTENVVNACLELGIDRLVFTSTCKAANPETVYGASKLVGERIVLNAGFTVARLYNVVETSRNVFRIWEEAVRNSEPCLVMEAIRRFVHLGEAVPFILSCFWREPGRYIPDSYEHTIEDIYHRWVRENSERNTGFVMTPRRRGDRFAEPRVAYHEFTAPQPDGAFRVTSPHD